MDNRGNITIEIGVALIIILMILGVVLSINEINTQKIVKNAVNEHDETLIEGIVDNLINNPGNKNNWGSYEKGTGLAIVNEEGHVIPNSVSYEKLMFFESDYNKYVYRNLFNSKIKSSMELIPKESIISSVKIGNEEDANNIYSVNRIVKCDFYKKYVLKNFQNSGKCNHDHDQDKYSCNYFKVFKGNLRASNYYLIFDESEKYNAKYFIDATSSNKYKNWKTIISDNVFINNEIDFYDESSAVVFIHIDKAKAKALLVCVPKTFDKSKLKYDYFRANECQFILRAWY
ncbi:hypothetical protein [Methanobrevibacter sp.]|uniref:hypothetical protein n=1 Tax=Methanobrevibacter sp. TaxID=66852 RepID=UPI0025DA0C0B|nr:hypothetical protein [Methanobrevibacter sp.]MBQ6512960.1 hypothetical protein [Methanobrevibacter sp.]